MPAIDPKAMCTLSYAKFLKEDILLRRLELHVALVELRGKVLTGLLKQRICCLPDMFSPYLLLRINIVPMIYQ